MKKWEIIDLRLTLPCKKQTFEKKKKNNEGKEQAKQSLNIYAVLDLLCTVENFTELLSTSDFIALNCLSIYS